MFSFFILLTNENLFVNITPVNGKKEGILVNYQSSTLGVGTSNIMAGHEKKRQMEFEFSKIKIVFPEDKIKKLYQLCMEKGVPTVAEQYMFSKEALAVVVTDYYEELKRKQSEQTKKNRKKFTRIFSEGELITDIKLNREDNNIIVLYANNTCKLFSGNQYRLVKNHIFDYGKKIVTTVEAKIMTDSDKKRICESDQDTKMDTIHKIIKRKTEVLLEERELYLKWKLYFEHQDEIEAINHYKTSSSDLKKMLQHRSISFKKLNSSQYPFKEVQKDYQIASKMFDRIQENEAELIQVLCKIK